MKKNVLTIAVAGAVAASAQAQMYVNPDNTGEVLIYPFYTADAGNQTYIHVVNTTDNYKAAKVRIHEAENSWEVRDFNLYLSPWDHFAFTIRLDEATGAGKLVTADTSCTVPQLVDGGIEFTNILFAKETNASLERTLNGYVEIIEMGQFSGAATGLGEKGLSPMPGYYWKHVDGVPRSCDTVEGLWSTDGPWFAEVVEGGGTSPVARTGELSTWTGGGLYGMGIIVNPEAGAAIGYDAVAIDGFHKSGATDTGGGDLHYYPGNVRPGLDGRTGYTDTTATVFVDGGAQNYSTAATAAPTLDAVSSLFMVETISNDYVLDAAFGGKTDWIVTFPTKRNYVKATAPTSSTRARNPFYDEWDGNESCDPYGIEIWDREEDYPTPIVGKPPFSPYTADPLFDPKICYEANVMTFTGVGEDPDSAMWGTEPSASSSRIHTAVETPYENGWARLSFDWAALNGSYTLGAQGDAHELDVANNNETTTLSGLPAVGFSIIKFERGNLDGGAVLANYAAAHEHKTTRDTVAQSGS